MERRFFDTSIWSSIPFRKLKPSLKTLYFYVWSKCDACGCYVVDFDYIKIDTGEKYSISDFEKLAQFSLKKISAGKFFFENFINVNYGTLKENYNPHKPAFRSLLKNNIEYNSSLNQACFKLEEEGVYEEEDEGEEEGKGEEERTPAPVVKVEIIYPFNSESFIQMWGNWIQFKKEQHNFTYKSPISEQAALKDLATISNGNEKDAIAFIEHAIKNGWKGIFKPKEFTNGTGKQTSIGETATDRAYQRAAQAFADSQGN